MLHRATPGAKTLSSVAPIFQQADLAFANLEVPLTNSAVPTAAKTAEELKRHDQYILKAAPGHAAYLAKAGIRMVSLANNHCMDYGPAGLAQMERSLDAAKVAHTGAGKNRADAMSPAIVRLKNGTRVGLLSAMAFVSNKALGKTTPATPKSTGVATLAFNGQIDDKAKEYLGRWISGAKARCDVLVVALHWGIERQTVPTYYQVALGRAVADAGADVVWGHHPHVLQGAEIYHGVPILYSTGNLVSSLPGDTGLFAIDFEAKKRLTFYPARISGNRCLQVTGPSAIDAKKRFEALCKTLNKTYPTPKTERGRPSPA